MSKLTIIIAALLSSAAWAATSSAPSEISRIRVAFSLKDCKPESTQGSTTTKPACDGFSSAYSDIQVPLSEKSAHQLEGEVLLPSKLRTGPEYSARIHVLKFDTIYELHLSLRAAALENAPEFESVLYVEDLKNFRQLRSQIPGIEAPGHQYTLEASLLPSTP